MSTTYPTVPGVTFKSITRFPGYTFGSDGSCWSLWKRVFYNRGSRNEIGAEWHRLNSHNGKAGYRNLAIRSDRDRWRRNYQLHRLILEAFVGPCPDGMEGCHNDGDPENNAISNLRWDTPFNNTADKNRHGTMLKGSQCCVAKINEDDVREMRRLRDTGLPIQKIADKFCMTRWNAARICSRRTWQHVS